MELVKREKKVKKIKQLTIEDDISEVPTVEGFECLLGESPTNYPKGEGIENMESELHFAANDSETYDQENSVLAAECNLQVAINEDKINATAPLEVNLDKNVKETNTSISTVNLENATSQSQLHNNEAATSDLSKSTLTTSNLKNVDHGNQMKEETKLLTDTVDSPQITLEEVKPFTASQLALLYDNQELGLIDMFISEFIEAQLKSNTIRQQHRLYELLMKYLRVRNHLIVNSHELSVLKKKCRETQKKLWCINTSHVIRSGECQDGNPVSATHEYPTAHFNKQALQSLSRTLSAIKEMLYNTQALYCYEAELLRLQIEHYVQSVCVSCREFTNISQNAPVSLATVQTPSPIIPQLVEIRMCITTLFYFQRKLLKDRKFVIDTRQWLTKLIAILLRVANWQDHLFLLNHILRCPGGVMNWAGSYVQMPAPGEFSKSSASPLNDPYLDHIVATLAVILLPVKERDTFLEQVQNSLQDTEYSPDDTVWVLLDQEGEEDEDITNTGANLYENDLISLFNQIPFEKVFQHVLYIQCQNEKYHQNKSFITHHHMLRLFAFFTIVIKILKQGLKTYDSPRYRQLAKRLCALIRDIVQYASDQWEEFDKHQLTDQSTLLKLQLEFDYFFLRAVLCIFSSRRLGAWQYLATVPYHLISSNTLWQIFYILHTDSTQTDIHMVNIDVQDWEDKLSCPQLRKQFEEKLCNMPGDESYFLLTTFANMAMARVNTDYDFVRATTIDLFQIGFLSEKTQDSCSKDAQSLLSNLTNKYPSLLSDILHKLTENFESVGKLSLYLFTELKQDKWIPQEQDINILSKWLHERPLISTENHLARLILCHLNWGYNENGDLHLPIELHRRIALLMVELAMKYVRDPPIESTSLLAEGVKQVSSMIRAQNAEQVFSLWAWEMVTRLKLHQLDQTEAICQHSLLNPADAFSYIPDMDSDPQLEVLVSGTIDKQPIACYVATVMTLWGHSVPLICLKGFSQLQILQSHYKYEQVLICLHHIVPLFLDCVDSLIKNEKFVSLIISLIMADRSYMNMAKSFIATEFPGTILKHFSNMIQSHLRNYKRYSQQTPTNFVYLWLNSLVLVPDWNKDQSVMYLMDTVISASFLYAETRATVETMFQSLSSNTAPARNAVVSFGSLFNWATGSSNSVSILGGSIQSVWVAYQVLSVEQNNREIKTGLWREILKELSAQNKITLDAAIKRACTTVKMQPFGASGLFIYRWSQQALDTPMDHPILPLLWQNFFALFLARVPSTTRVVDHGGIGEKFFEGMINLSYLKKIKKRLNDTTAYFQLRAERDLDDDKPITDERRTFYLNAAKFYKTLSLWLEEPRLQEPGFYLSALPPQYLSQKLILLVQEDWTPWLEYVDYWTVQENQIKAVREWESLCYRDQENQFQSRTNTLITFLEITDPLQRIFKRFTMYEHPIPPPPINQIKSVLSHIPTNILYDFNSTIDCVKPYFKTILDYAQTYNLLISEHTAADCNFLELVPTLYRQVQKQITLHALCDSVLTNDKRPRSGTPPTVHCAGAAVIRVRISEAHVNEAVDIMVTQNRAEYENLLLKASQPPPSKVTQACVFIDHLIAMFEHEIILSRASENTAMLYRIQESGVKLFYYLIECYTEEAAFCPPTKQLITTCLERLGQLFISGEESQGPQLLSTIMQRPNLGGLLGPYFTPIAGGASKFLQMYQTVVELSIGRNIDLCFVLLSKFDIGCWLNYRRPKLSERSTFIDLVSRALCNMGLNPDKEKLILHELFRNHLRLVLLHEFPEHYGEVLSVVLKNSESQNLSLDVWRDLLGTLSGKPKNSFTIQPSKIRDDIRHYAIEQRLLSRQEMFDTAILLSRHFMQERLQYGLYGLYPKYRVYNEPLTVFLGMVGHALVVLTLQSDRGSLGVQLCEKIWPVLSDMYSPWITPYWTRNLKEPTAAWIQQLTDDRSVLLPWIITDGPHAHKIVAMFVECIRFIIDTLPTSSKILSFVWQFYVTNFAHASVKDHILNVIHGNFLSLPWDHFYPGINDIELMIKVIDQYLPESHLFLGSIFTSVNWTTWMNEFVATQPLPIAARIHVCLLNLLVKLSTEPNVRQNDRASQLINEAEKFSWHLLDATAYDPVINWHVMSCDPKVILSMDSDQCHPIDIAVNNLLKVSAEYSPFVTHFHVTTLKKKQMYVRASVKLLISCTTRHKSLLSTSPKLFTNTLLKMLDDMEAVIMNTVPVSQQTSETGLLITELFHTINQSEILMEYLRTSWASWLLKRTATNPILIAVLRVMNTTITSPSILGELMEAALEAYFKFNVSEETQSTWASVLTILQPTISRKPPLDTVLVSEGRILTLYSVLLKQLPLCQDIKEEGEFLLNLVNWISAMRPTDTNEEKLPLLWAKTCELVYRQCQYNENNVIAVKALKGLARVLLTIADDGGQSWGILGAIGFKKGSQLSVRCKFLSRAIGVYCLAQLPESKSDQQLVRFTPNSPGVAPVRTADPDSLDIRPSAEAIKAMQTLERLSLNKQYVELKGDIERSIRLIRDSGNSIHNAVTVIGVLTMELYNQRYLHVLMD
ncbi:ectopic P-granules autophagy protein 5 isoform X1 [Halictus rubicundus]|uniref:ectopic P-granules autophagy protein 5 isoform X1 n=1 Tax=Halictus rubicundus TaxID=77578 RepID=UPI0040364384